MALALVAGTTGPSASHSADGRWTQVTPRPAPAFYTRYGHVLAYVATGDRLIVFGGQGETPTGVRFHNDLWACAAASGEPWVPLQTQGPSLPPRAEMASIYDPVGRRMIVFGGSDGQSGYNDLWSIGLRGVPTVTQLSPAGTPPDPRFGCTAVYDSFRRRMILYGGYLTHSGAIADDLWELSLAGELRWTRLAPTGTPRGRYLHTAIVDPERDRMLVFGGRDETPAPLGELWELSLADPPAWRIIPGPGPERRQHLRSVYDPVRDRMVIYGGVALDPGGGSRASDVWAFQLGPGGTWQQIFPTGSVHADLRREGHGAVYDPVRDRMIVVGGLTSHHTNDVLAMSLSGTPTWRMLHAYDRFPPVEPAFTTEKLQAVYDTRRDRAIVIGSGPSAYAAEVWATDFTHEAEWVRIEPANAPPEARYNAAALYDSLLDRILIVGGDGFQDVLSFDLATGTWTTLDGLQPPADFHPSQSTVVFDRARYRILVFGGCCPYVSTTRVIGLDPVSGHARPIVSLPADGPSPSPRRRSLTALDALRDRLLIHGGEDATHTLGDTWALSLSEPPGWSEIAPLPDPGSGAPLVPPGISSFVDSRRDRMVLGQTWSLLQSGTPQWDALDPVGPGPAAPLTNLHYDTPHDRAIAITQDRPGYPAPLRVWIWTFDPRTIEVTHASADTASVRIEWRTNQSQGPAATVYRSEVPGPWVSLGPASVSPAGIITFVDHTVSRGARYTYRLGVTDGAGETFYGEVSVTVPNVIGPPAPVVVGARPNPATGTLRLVVTTPVSGPARVDVIDLNGRLMWSGEAPAEAGEHVVSVVPESAFGSGIYLVRVRQGELSAQTRVVFLR